MKTIDMLAKYLNEWPLKYSRIVQAEDCVFMAFLLVMKCITK
nr:hypothetical protein [Escherichia coli]